MKKEKDRNAIEKARSIACNCATWMQNYSTALFNDVLLIDILLIHQIYFSLIYY